VVAALVEAFRLAQGCLFASKGPRPDDWSPPPLFFQRSPRIEAVEWPPCRTTGVVSASWRERAYMGRDPLAVKRGRYRFAAGKSKYFSRFGRVFFSSVAHT
jgi:hypothetical protein